MTSLASQCEHLRAKLNEAVHNLEAMQLESKANRYIVCDFCVCNVYDNDCCCTDLGST